MTTDLPTYLAGVDYFVVLFEELARKLLGLGGVVVIDKRDGSKLRAAE